MTVVPFKPGEWADGKRSIDLCAKEYPPLEQFVSGFLTTGLTILSATPKSGKTTLVHDLALHIGCGGRSLGVLPCEPSDVLCLFLEDSERRAVTRERELLGNGGGVEGVTYFFQGSSWPIGRLERYLDQTPMTRVVIIDTAERYRQATERERSGNVYKDDYAFWGALQTMAGQRKIALIMLHHDRKPNGNTGNIIDTVSGTRAIAGAADHLWFLERDRETNITRWTIEGRDLEYTSISYERTPARRLQSVVGSSRRVAEERDERIGRAREMREEGKSFNAIAQELGVAKTTVQRWCE